MTKRLLVKNFKLPKLPDNYHEEKWGELREAVTGIQTSRTVPISYEILYDCVANLCNMRMADEMYKRLEDLVDTHVRQAMDKISEARLEGIQFLRLISDLWMDNCRQMLMIRSIFLYLDRSHVLTRPSVLSIWDMGLEKFRRYFTSHPEIEKRTIKELLALIEKERKNEIVDRQLLKDLLHMLSDLSLYASKFESHFLEETRRLYLDEGNELANSLSVPAYLNHVDKRLREESDRLLHYLDSSTRPQLMQKVDKMLIAEHVKLILSKGLDQLLKTKRMDVLSLLHKLLTRVDSGPIELCNHFNEYIKTTGKSIVTDLDKDKTMVVELLEFKRDMDTVVTECFQNQERFVNSLKEAFEYFINQRPNKPAELIAKYVDTTLKSGNKCNSDDELERLLDQIMVLFRFIHGKDVFEAFYKKDLAKRLLVNKSASIDAEKSMLFKLKQECGAAFTSKLEGMFKDVELSRDIGTAFKNYLANNSTKLGVDLTVHVLTMGYWPTYTPMAVEMPSDLLESQNTFQKFYLQKYSGRKLQWQPNLGGCVLMAHFPVAKKELQVSMLQAIVLLLFNDREELTFEEMKEKTKIDLVELKRTLQSLACGKVRVLIKEPKGKEINDNDRFIYASKFTYPLCRIRINQVQLKETQEEQTNTHERVFQDRQYQIDAAIVRIMKTRKSLMHTNLMTELFDQLKFPLKSQDIKKRIESLIERDYIVRDKAQPNQYNYVA